MVKIRITSYRRPWWALGLMTIIDVHEMVKDTSLKEASIMAEMVRNIKSNFWSGVTSVEVISVDM